jgi:hypothetical protein
MTKIKDSKQKFYTFEEDKEGIRSSYTIYDFHGFTFPSVSLRNLNFKKSRIVYM